MGLMLEPQQITSAVHARRAQVDAAQWFEAAQQVRTAGGGLIAVWGGDERDRGAANWLRTED
jgi:hypothetical protein